MSTDTATTFAQLGLAPPVLRAVDDVGYEAPTAIQAEAIPSLLAGRDLLGQAQTGTGKTAAFALPLLSRLDLGRKRPQILVLTPTRELAIQVAEAMQTYARHLSGFHVVPVYGGQSIDTQLRRLRRGVHAVVGTPGRLRDHLRRGTLDLEGLSTVVIDEADEMLRMGFLEEVEEILEQTPADKQVALFSATLPAPIKLVAGKYLRDPVEVRSRAATATVATVRQRYWRVAGTGKLHALTRILEVEDFDAMLVFVRTRIATAELSEKLEARGFASAPLSGDMNQAMRERTVEGLRNGRLDIVVATDVAARGLDVDRVSHVVNFDIPYDVEAYVHRIGRTARAGRKGEAILFVSPRERRGLFAIERATGQPIEPMSLPSREDVADRRLAQLKRKIADTIEAQDLEPLEAMIDGYLEEHDVELSTVAAALAFLAQGERPLPAPSRAAPRAADERPAPGTEPRRRRPSEPRPSEPRPSETRPFEPRAPRPARKAALPRAFTGGPKDDQVVMQRYRIEVGRDHGVEPGNIVGAISNEGALDGRYIGRIQTFDVFSLVDLPEGMPRETLRHLKTVRVCGQALRIRAAEPPPPAPAGRTPAGKPPARPPGKPSARPPGKPSAEPPKAFKKKQRHKKKRKLKKNRAQRRAERSARED
jgi:ATP-dependent RNA helicase DeaD